MARADVARLIPLRPGVAVGHHCSMITAEEWAGAQSSLALSFGSHAAAANSTVAVAKESHPFRSASLTEKCNKSSSLVFDELFEWMNGEHT